MSNLSELLPTGGGQNAVDFVASGTLSSGQTVALKSDGTVEAVALGLSSGESETFYGGNAIYISAVFDSSANKVVVAYQNQGNSNYGTAIVGTVSGSSISFGTAVVFEAAESKYISATFDSSNNKVVIAYEDVGNSQYGTAIVGTVSGTSISFGTAVVFEAAAVAYTSATFDSNSNKVVIAYRDEGNSGYGTAIVGTVSGTSISFGSPTVFNSGSIADTSATYDSTNSKPVISYRNVPNSNYGTAIVGTVSGTSISFGTAVVFETAVAVILASTFDSANGKVVIAYRDNGNSSYGTAIVGTVSGTSISFGTAVVFSEALFQFGSITFDSSLSNILIFYNDLANSSYATVIAGTVSGTGISFDSPIVIASTSTNYFSSTFDSSANSTVVAYRNASISTAESIVVVGTNSADFIGITAGAISDTATGAVNVYGGINEAQTGLTIGSDYYVQDDGSLSTTASSVKVGQAISATTINMMDLT